LGSLANPAGVDPGNVARGIEGVGDLCSEAGEATDEFPDLVDALDLLLFEWERPQVVELCFGWRGHVVHEAVDGDPAVRRPERAKRLDQPPGGAREQLCPAGMGV